MPAPALAHVGLRPLQRRRHAVQPLAEVGRAEGGELQRARSPRRSSPAGMPSRQSGCFRRETSATGSKRLAAASTDEIEQRADGGLGKRLAGRVARPRRPHASSLTGDAPRQQRGRA